MDYMCTSGLIFRVSEGRTVVEGDMIPYSDQLEEMLEDVAAFRKYVREHIRELYITVELSERE